MIDPDSDTPVNILHHKSGATGASIEHYTSRIHSMQTQQAYFLLTKQTHYIMFIAWGRVGSWTHRQAVVYQMLVEQLQQGNRSFWWHVHFY